MLASVEASGSGVELPPPRSFPTTHRLIVGDARRVSPREIGPVQLVATSPPYWTIHDYGSPSQIGFGQTLPKYLDHLSKVWATCYSALQDGCRLVVNIGDQYLRAAKGTPYQIVPLHTSVVNSVLNAPRSGFLYLGSIVWRKVSTTRPTGGASVMGSYPYPRAVYPCFENEFIAIFRKPGDPPRPEQETKELARLDLAQWRELTQGVWTQQGSRMEENPAEFPAEIPARLIRMFTFPGETVLDPFVGSGTTMRAAASLGRNSVGIEVGFRTRSGRPFQEAIREKVTSAPQAEAYSGPVSFEVSRGRPVAPQPSHS